MRRAFRFGLLAVALLGTGCAQSLKEAKSDLLFATMGSGALLDEPTLGEAEVKQQLSAWLKQVKGAVDGKWVLVLPPNTPLDLSCTLSLRFAPDGHALKASIKKPSGVAEFDQSLLRAALAAQPPPFPSQQAYDYVMKHGGGLAITFVR